MTRCAVVLLMLLVSCTSGEGLPRAGDVVVANAEVRIAPAAARSAAGYLELRHLGAVADTLVAVSSDAGAASLHSAMVEGGLMQMQPLDRLELLPLRPTRFAPGGLHIMLDHFTRPLAVGDTVQFTLQLARGGEVTVTAPVRAVGDD